jgi:hypothetical protein
MSLVNRIPYQFINTRTRTTSLIPSIPLETKRTNRKRTVHHLPEELIGDIFHIYIHEYQGNWSGILHVDRHWRTVAERRASLWSKFTIDTCHRTRQNLSSHKLICNTVSILQHILSLSKQAPLTIHIYVRTRHLEEQQQLCQMVHLLDSNVTARIYDCMLYGYYIWASQKLVTACCKFFSSPMPLLQKLHIESSHAHSLHRTICDSVSNNSPRIQHLVGDGLFTYLFHRTPLPLTHLTIVHGLTNFATISPFCKTLTFLSCSCLSFPSAPLDEMVTFPLLTTITIQTLQSFACFLNVNLPVLEDLSIGTDHQHFSSDEYDSDGTDDVSEQLIYWPRLLKLVIHQSFGGSVLARIRAPLLDTLDIDFFTYMNYHPSMHLQNLFHGSPTSLQPRLLTLRFEPIPPNSEEDVHALRHLDLVEKVVLESCQSDHSGRASSFDGDNMPARFCDALWEAMTPEPHMMKDVLFPHLKEIHLTLAEINHEKILDMMHEREKHGIELELVAINKLYYYYDGTVHLPDYMYDTESST